MATFGLVHGICSGGWAWIPVIQPLQEAGHRVVAVDLPCEDPAAGFDDYVAAVDEAVGDADDLILVAHSGGGLTIPLVAARRPVRELIYVCAMLPVPGRSQAELGGDYAGSGAEEWLEFHEDGTFSVRPEAVGPYVVPEADADTARGISQLMRRQSLSMFVEPCPLEEMPRVPTRYILCREDRIIDPDWSRRAAPERLGVTPIELPGGHSPMLAHTGELVDLLLAGEAG